jgi:hypothetical protein
VTPSAAPANAAEALPPLWSHDQAVPRLIAGLLLFVLVAACGGAGSPTPTPGGMNDVMPALVLRGATIHDTVSGDGGCPSVPLHPNAARIEMTVADDESRYVVYLFRWRRPADFTAAAQPFEECLDEFAGQVDGEVLIDVVDAPPWRAYGAGWSEEVRLLIDEALNDLAGS